MKLVYFTIFTGLTTIYNVLGGIIIHSLPIVSTYHGHPSTNPGSPCENDFMAPKYYVEDMMGHPNHHLRI